MLAVDMYTVERFSAMRWLVTNNCSYHKIEIGASLQVDIELP